MKDKVNQIVTILIWVVGVVLWALKGWWYIVAAVFLLHLVEVFLKGVKIGKRAGKPVFFSIIMTLIFGYTWWLPLQKSLEE